MISCITANEEFLTVCLNVALKTLCVGIFLEQRGDKKEETKTRHPTFRV